MGVVAAAGATPRSFTAGNFVLTTLQSGPTWRILVVTPSLISSNAAYAGFCCVAATNDDGGLYMVNRQLQLYNGAGGGTLVGSSNTLTWNAGTPFTLRINLAAGANASSIVVSGAATGNGTTTFTSSGTYFTNSTLGIGHFAATGTFQWAGTIGEIDDAAGLSRTAATSAAADIASSANRTLVRSATTAAAAGIAATAVSVRVRSADSSAAAGASTAATLAPAGSQSRTVALTVAADIVTAATRALARTAAADAAADVSSSAVRSLVRTAAASATDGASTAATVSGAVAFGPGAQTSGLWTDGHSAAVCTIPGGYLPAGGGGADMDGRTPPASIATETTGSTFYLAVARPVATANKTITDNKGNTYTSLVIGDYGGVSAWESQILVCVAGAGGAAHTWTANSILNDETTFAVDEIKKCQYLAGYVTSFTVVGSTQISPTGLNLKGPGWVYVDWFGEGPVSGAEGFDWTVTAVNEGPTVGSQWQVVDSRIRNHTDGWIQWKRWRRYYAAAATNIQMQLATVSPNQGARWYAAAFMEANVTEATAATSAAADIITSALGRHERAASSSAAAGASTAATGAYARTATASAAAGVQTSAVSVRARTAVASAAADVATAAVRSTPRSATIAAAVDASAAATRILERSAASSAEAGASTAATVSAGSGPVERTASATAAADIVTSATRTLQRAVSASAAAGSATSALRVLSRSATASAAAGASTGATVTGQAPAAALPLPARIAISVIGAAPFRVDPDFEQ